MSKPSEGKAWMAKTGIEKFMERAKVVAIPQMEPNDRPILMVSYDMMKKMMDEGLVSSVPLTKMDDFETKQPMKTQEK